MRIKYIGPRAQKRDNVAGTGLVWTKTTPVHEVINPRAAALLLKYPGVWVEDKPETVEPKPVSTVEAPKRRGRPPRVKEDGNDDT